MSLNRSHLFLLVLIILVFTSCRKEEDTIAIINVVNAEGVPEPGRTVKMLGESTGQDQTNIQEIAINREGVTDANGQARFDFTDDFELGQAGFAVLNVEVYKGDTIFESIIKVDPEETTEETVIIN